MFEWQFWIDVGGTFTDCLARQGDAPLVRCKLLSSGVTKGEVEAVLEDGIVDTRRGGDPTDYWVGCEFHLIDESGERIATTTVTEFNAAKSSLTFTATLNPWPVVGQRYELTPNQPAPVLAIRRLLGLSLQDTVPPVSVRLGATRGTNALLTRTGAVTGFVTTAGFADILEIGYQNRPKLFELDINKTTPLYARVCEVEERISASGEVLTPLAQNDLAETFASWLADGVDSLAICLLNAYTNSQHEEAVADIARRAGFEEISVSSEVSPLMKLVSRGDTTVVDAYLTPVMRGYVASLKEALPGTDLQLLTSAGALVTPNQFSGKDSILSGPAGGVVGFSKVASAAGFERAIGFDMGGTSTDVSRFDGTIPLEFENEKAGVRIVAPMMAIETVAAGGGSVCSFDGVKLTVGPDSAGSDPGPACYGRGGPLCVTDLNFYLGKILPQRFPFPLDRNVVDVKLRELTKTIQQLAGVEYTSLELAEGFLRVANANMAQAIATVSLAKGFDPKDYILAAFGGAAGQHACAVASELDMERILIHPHASILSAYGIGMADIVRHRAIGIYRTYTELLPELDEYFTDLADDALRDLEASGVAESLHRPEIELRRSLDLRYRGLDAYLNIPEPNDGDYRIAYEREHQRLYGYKQSAEIEIVAMRVAAVALAITSPPTSRKATARTPKPIDSALLRINGKEHRSAVFLRQRLRPGDIIDGPAIIAEELSTTIIDPGWRSETLSEGELLISRTSGDVETRKDVGETKAQENFAIADPIQLELFNNQFAAIAEQMGVRLRNSASSVNVKERLDFSCAVFTAQGDLVVNAPHIPVHLAAMSETVKCVLQDNPNMAPGDAFLTNDPYRGGSHLPDLTVVTPVHSGDGELMFLTASRAHHAEIGGIAPGSMPPFSKALAEEGVLIQNFHLVERGRFREGELMELLISGDYPSRDAKTNLADIRAQVAANWQGAQDLLGLVKRRSWPVVGAHMKHIQTAAETKVRRALEALPDGRREFADHLDDGSVITVAITIEDDVAEIDFTGSAPESAGNLNANRAIVTAATLYCLRCLLDEEIPLNQGVLAPITLTIPNGILNPSPGADAASSPAIVGGNVETSQRIVDVLLGAFGLAAASQGTMNNFLFGNEEFGYYETICGGAGATATSDGADAVHTHMTNTRLTDPEVLERRYPASLVSFSIRRGSGGAGEHVGGNGVTRKIRFEEELSISLLTSRRGPYEPYGMNGGAAGALGINQLIRANGEMIDLAGTTQIDVCPGDTLIIHTPGGGGWGSITPKDDSEESAK